MNYLENYTPCVICRCVPTNYYARFLANAVVVQCVLITLVWVSWAFDERTSKGGDVTGGQGMWTKTAKRGDYYFAFFMVYPTICKTCFSHFNCRQLSETLWVLKSHYSTECWTTFDSWFMFAIFAAAGIVLVSFGVQIVYFFWMRRVYGNLMTQVVDGDLSRIEAFRNFRLQFDYIAGNFRPECYAAECVDLIRKLLLSSCIMFVSAGSSMQSYLAVGISVIFLVIHVGQMPYPFVGSNMLKMFTELQILFVMVTSLALRIDPQVLKSEGYSLEFY
eukprot:COSAG05_NODE_6483_length_949_cov_0.982353_1_plen_275_part_10